MNELGVRDMIERGRKSVKILILSQYWAPENGVPQRRWSWLSQMLVEQGHQITVIAPPPHYDRRISPAEWVRKFAAGGFNEEEIGDTGELILRSPFLPAGNSLTARALNQAFVGVGAVFRVLWRTGSLKGYKPDVIIGTVPAIPIAMVVWLVSKLYRRPYIVDLRDAWPDLLEQADSWNSGMGRTSLRQRVLSKGPLQITSWSTKKIMNHSLSNANAIIATSERLEQNLRSRPELRRHNGKREIVTIRNVFPPETSLAQKQTRNHNADTLNVLYAGTIGRAQNLGNAVEAVRIAKAAGLEIQFRIVGSGAEKSELRSQSADLLDSVSLEPVRPADELATYYEWADTALVHLADWEPLERTVPSKVYELLDSGIHVSAVVQGETAKLVTGLDAGDVVAPNDPQELAELWIQLARDRDRLTTSGLGHAWVKRQREEIVPQTLGDLLRAVRGAK